MKHIFFSVLLSLFSAFCAKSQCNKLLDFSGAADGSYPHGSLLYDGSYMYGMTRSGGVNDLGLIFKIRTDGTGYTKLLDFAGSSNGSKPQSADGALVSDGTFLYGVTTFGGLYDQGVLFKIMPDGSGFSKLIDFMGTTNGDFPNGSLYYDGTFLYGMTVEGGATDEGIIYKIKPDGTNFTKLLDFSALSTGKNPFGSLLSDGTYLYGMTYNGGTNDYGTIFKIKTNGTGFMKLLDFAGPSNGAWAQGSFVTDGTFLYGVTSKGGVACPSTDGCGVIFKIKMDGTGYATLMDFPDGISGAGPSGSLLYDGMFLYGMTHNGGTGGMGTMFQIKPDGSAYSVLMNFSGAAEGGDPDGSLISDGTNFYGMTADGGDNNMGTIFRFGPTVTGIAETTNNESFNIYPNPSENIFTIDLHSQAKAEMSLQIRNAQGALVYTESKKDLSGEYQIDLSKQSPGIYLVEIISGEKRTVKKLIIE